MARFALGMLILSLCLFALWDDNLMGVLDRINPGFLFLCFIALVGSTLVGASNLFLLLSRRDPTPFWALLKGFWFAWAFNLVSPGQVGDLAVLSNWLKGRGVAWHQGFSYILIDKLLSLLVILGFSLWGLVGISGWVIDLVPGRLAVLGISLFGALFIVLFLLLKSTAVNDFVSRFLEVSLDYLREFPGTVLANAGVSVIKFTFTGAAYWWGFQSVGETSLSFFTVLGLVASSSLIAYLPISFNGIGTVEVTGIALFGLFQVPAEVVLVVYLLMRALVFMVAWLPVGLCLIFSGSKTPPNSV